MTLLVGGSVVLIGASTIALTLGWLSAQEALIWTSIVASVGAGVLLALAYFRSRTEIPNPPPQKKAKTEPRTSEGQATQEFSVGPSRRPDRPGD